MKGAISFQIHAPTTPFVPRIGEEGRGDGVGKGRDGERGQEEERFYALLL